MKSDEPQSSSSPEPLRNPSTSSRYVSKPRTRASSKPAVSLKSAICAESKPKTSSKAKLSKMAAPPVPKASGSSKCNINILLRGSCLPFIHSSYSTQRGKGRLEIRQLSRLREKSKRLCRNSAILSRTRSSNFRSAPQQNAPPARTRQFQFLAWSPSRQRCLRWPAVAVTPRRRTTPPPRRHPQVCQTRSSI